MKAPLFPDFDAEVYDVVRQIPAGRVATYGQIARLVGCPLHARRVGKAMSRVPAELQLPCHRVVNSAGRTVPGWAEQRAKLESEGVRFTRGGCVDMKRHTWEDIL